MKPISIVSFLTGSFVLLSAIAASAQTAPTSAPVVAAQELTPFQLVTMAYQGFFKGEGIPAGNRFVDRYESEQIAAKDLVQAAIQARRLSSNALNDHQYLHSVDTQLVGFIDLSR